MKRMLLDTNIYGLIVVDPESVIVKEGLKSAEIVIYGNSVIRKELRATPPRRIDGINLRLDLLRLYDELVKKELEIKKQIADAYAQAYRELGGSISLAKLENDFLIVACSSAHNLGIVVSEDNSTMLNELAMKSYKIVNTALNLGLPRFIGYEEFKKQIKK